MKYILPIYLIWRSVLFIAADIGAFFLIRQPNFLGREFEDNFGYILWQWANFDGAHYLWIANYSYRQFENAFFPGYPGLIKVISVFLPDSLLVGFLISNFALLISLYYLYKLFLLDYSLQTTLKAIVLLLCFPAAFFLGAVYSESLFLCLAVTSFYFARKHQFVLASALGIAASSVRLVGVILVPALLVIWYYDLYRHRKTKTSLLNILPITCIPLGLALVMLLNYVFSADPLGFFHVQNAFGANRSGSGLILLPQVLFRYLKIFSTSSLNYNLFIAAQEFLLTIGSLGVLLWWWKKIRLEYLLFSLCVIIIPTLTGTLSSMPRYILAAFPLCVVCADLCKNNKVFFGLLLVLGLFEIINIALFTSGFWVS
jgi:hypothetical protein